MSIDFRELANTMIREIIPYQPGKPIEELQRELGITDSIKLASNENPLGPSPLAIQVGQFALLQAHIYPDGNCFELKQALADLFSVKCGQITVGNGSENILELIVKSYLHQGDTAIISQYAFLTIPLLIQSYGAIAKVVPAKQFSHDVHAMVNAIDDKTRIIFIVNPNNPTGTYINLDDFKYLMSHIPSHVLVVVDEAYAEYIDEEDYPDTIALLPTYPNLIVTRTFSKAYGLAGLRLGYAISSLDIADILNRARLPFNVNIMAVKVGCAALTDKDHLTKTKHLNQRGMQQLNEELTKLQLINIPSMANFIMIEINNAEKIYQQLLMQGVIVRPLAAYHLPQYIRVTIGTHEQNERFLRSLHNLL